MVFSNCKAVDLLRQVSGFLNQATGIISCQNWMAKQSMGNGTMEPTEETVYLKALKEASSKIIIF